MEVVTSASRPSRPGSDGPVNPADADPVGRGPAAPGRAAAALAGLVTAAAGMATAAATASVLGLRLSPVGAVAEGVVEATPGGVARVAIDLVGQWDKPLLVAGVLVVVLGLGAIAGLVARRRLLVGQLLWVALAGLGLLAVLTRPGVAATGLLPILVGAATWLLMLPFLLGPGSVTAGPSGSDPDGQRDPGERRAFLRRVLLVGAGAGVLALGGRVASGGRRAVQATRARLDLPVTGGTVPAGADLEVSGLVPWRVSNEEFYRIDTALVVPALEVDSWRLRIHGLVEQEVTLSFEDLLNRQLTEAWVTLCCVSNPVGGDLIGNAWWSGVRVAELLAQARPLPGADVVLQTSADGWTCSTPLEVLTDDRDALLAVAMNGAPLPLQHGFPVRMVVPGLYGYVSATKWLVDLEVTRFDRVEAYWTRRGWAPRAPVKTQSRVDVPRGGQDVAAGSVTVAGVAWAQHTGIASVEVRLDGGPWEPVDLARVPSVDTWVQWRGTVQAAAGRHTLAVRATDRSGATQTGVRRDVVPDGATGWHTIEFTATEGT